MTCLIHICLWVKNEYLKNPGLLKGKIDPTATCGPRLGFLFDPQPFFFQTFSRNRLVILAGSQFSPQHLRPSGPRQVEQNKKHRWHLEGPKKGPQTIRLKHRKQIAFKFEAQKPLVFIGF